MISERIQELINQLIQMELTASHLYLAMSSYFHRLSLVGIERWNVIQYREKGRNAHRLVNYLNDRDGTAEIRTVPSQPTNFGSPAEAFQMILAHEEGVTKTYEQAYAIAFEEGDLQTAVLMEEFIREQTEVVSLDKVVLGRMQLAGNDPAALLLIDRELGHAYWSRTRPHHHRGRRRETNRREHTEQLL